MLRLLALLGLHFLVSFALLPDNVLVSHPVHHDDYTNLAAGLAAKRDLGARPISTLLIAATADLGPQFAYSALNLLVVLCVWLSLRFVELYARDGRPLPIAGFVAAGVLALAFPTIVDWTKYFGLLTNLSSAVFALAAMCLMPLMRARPERAFPLGAAMFALVALSFWSKEDFALPLLVTAAGIFVTGGRLRWAGVTAGIGILFAAALAWNRRVGSVFVSGMRGPDDPYYMDLSPVSLVKTFAAMFLEAGFTRALLSATLVLVTIALVAKAPDRTAKIRLATLPAIALSPLLPYAIFPNHAFAYYGFLASTLLAATLVAAAYAGLGRSRG